MPDKKSTDVQRCDSSSPSITKITNQLNDISFDEKNKQNDMLSGDRKNRSDLNDSNLDEQDKNVLKTNGINANDQIQQNKSKTKAENKVMNADSTTTSVSPTDFQDGNSKGNSPISNESNGNNTKTSKIKQSESVDFFLGLQLKDRSYVVEIETTILDHYSRASLNQKKALEDENNSSPPPIFSSPSLLIVQPESYKRLLIHRVCDYYNLDRNVEELRHVIIYNNNTEFCQVFQKKPLKEYFNDKRNDQNLHDEQGLAVNRKVLKRGDSSSTTTTGSIDNCNGLLNNSASARGASPNNNNINSNSIDSSNHSTLTNNSKVSSFVNNKTRSLEEKEQRYEQVRSKIFQQDSSTGNGEKEILNGNHNSDKRTSQTYHSDENGNSKNSKNNSRSNYNSSNSSHTNGSRRYNNTNGKANSYKKNNQNNSPTSSSTSSNGSRQRFHNYQNQQKYQSQPQMYQQPYQFSNQYPSSQQGLNVNHFMSTNSLNNNGDGVYSNTAGLLPAPISYQTNQNGNFSHVQRQQAIHHIPQQNQQPLRASLPPQHPILFNSLPQAPVHQAQGPAPLSMHLQSAQAHLIPHSIYNYTGQMNALYPQASNLNQGRTILGPQSQSHLPMSGLIGNPSGVNTTTTLSSTNNSNMNGVNNIAAAQIAQPPPPPHGTIYYPMFQAVPYQTLNGLQTLPHGHQFHNLTGGDTKINANAGYNIEDPNYFGQQQYQSFY